MKLTTISEFKTVLQKAVANNKYFGTNSKSRRHPFVGKSIDTTKQTWARRFAKRFAHIRTDTAGGDVHAQAALNVLNKVLRETKNGVYAAKPSLRKRARK